jgi:autotransporter passenger strand-loop-strand repeat protein
LLLSLAAPLPAIDLPSGSTLTIAGTGDAGGGEAQTIDTIAGQPGLLVSAGDVALADLSIAGASAGGGAAVTVDAGGALELQQGSNVAGATVLAGGALKVEAGGAVTGATVDSGGRAIVSSGGAAADTVIAGGTLEVQAGGALTGSVAFAGAGTLKIDGAAAPAATISGFGVDQTIDLSGLSYSAAGSATLTADNVLQISEGGQTVKLDLDPAQNYAGHGFALASDGHGGTAVTDPTTSFTVSSEGATSGNTAGTTLNGANRSIDVGGADAATNTAYTIKVDGTIDLTRF